MNNKLTVTLSAAMVKKICTPHFSALNPTKLDGFTINEGPAFETARESALMILKSALFGWGDGTTDIELSATRREPQPWYLPVVGE